MLLHGHIPATRNSDTSQTGEQQTLSAKTIEEMSSPLLLTEDASPDEENVPESAQDPEQETENAGESSEQGEGSENEASASYIILSPEHDGINEKRNKKAVIDYSHISDGYFMVQRLADTDHRFKVLVKIKGITYSYNLDSGDWATFPLSEGDGSYQVSVYENVSGTKYANVISVSFKAKITDPFAPFLRPNLHVNYLNAPSMTTS